MRYEGTVQNWRRRRSLNCACSTLRCAANGQFIRNPTFTADCPNDGFVSQRAIPAPLQGDREPMSECPELESARRALSVHERVSALKVGHS